MFGISIFIKYTSSRQSISCAHMCQSIVLFTFAKQSFSRSIQFSSTTRSYSSISSLVRTECNTCCYFIRNKMRIKNTLNTLQREYTPIWLNFVWNLTWQNIEKVKFDEYFLIDGLSNKLIMQCIVTFRLYIFLLIILSVNHM